jgi:hypothetical protein
MDKQRGIYGISLQEVQAYGAALETAQRRGGSRARTEVKGWMAAHPGASVEEVREATVGIVMRHVATYGEAAASCAADLYDDTMAAAGVNVPRAEVLFSDPEQSVERAVRYQVQHVVEGDEAAYLDAVDSMTQYYVRRCANQTTMRNAERDNRYVTKGGLGTTYNNRNFGQLHQPTANVGFTDRTRRTRRRYPEALKPGDIAFARVPTGAETCTYCMMLASRGFAYRSEESAGHADHRGCNCLIIAGIHGSSYVEGVDVDEQYRVWKELASVDAKVERGELTRDEGEQRKQDIVDAHPNATAQLPAADARKRDTQGVELWYTPRDYERDGQLDAPRIVPL